MSSESLWRSLGDLADAWQESEVVQRFTSQLPRNAGQRSSGLPGILQQAHAAAGSVMAHPLRYASALRIIAPIVPEIDPPSFEADHREWLEAAQRVETAHRLTIAWIRARLPGYPQLPTPHLAPGTPWTTDEFSHRLTWSSTERGQGLQFQGAPQGVADLLRTEVGARAIERAGRALAVAMEGTDEWTRLRLATAALDESSRRTLRETRRRIRDRLSRESIDDHEPSLAMRRAEYREVVTAEEVRSLSGEPAEYAQAFSAANDLIEYAASEVFGQLTCYGIERFAPEQMDTTLGDPPRVSFKLTDPRILPDVGMLAWLDDPLVDDAVWVSEVQIQFQSVGELTVHTGARVLLGSSSAWL